MIKKIEPNDEDTSDPKGEINLHFVNLALSKWERKVTMDWSFDKPDVPHTVVYIFNKQDEEVAFEPNGKNENNDFEPKCEIDLDDYLYPLCMDWSFDKPIAPHIVVYIFNAAERCFKCEAVVADDFWKKGWGECLHTGVFFALVIRQLVTVGI